MLIYYYFFHFNKKNLSSNFNNKSKLDKAKLISRMAKMGQPMLPQMMNTTSPQQPAGIIYGVEDEDWVYCNFIH